MTENPDVKESITGQIVCLIRLKVEQGEEMLRALIPKDEGPVQVEPDSEGLRTGHHAFSTEMSCVQINTFHGWDLRTQGCLLTVAFALKVPTVVRWGALGR